MKARVLRGGAVIGIALALGMLAPAARADGSSSGTIHYLANGELCGRPDRVDEEVSVEFVAPQLTMTLADGTKVTGNVEDSGKFEATGGGHSFQGQAQGAELSGRQLYDNGTCTANYLFTLTLGAPIFASGSPTKVTLPPRAEETKPKGHPSAALRGLLFGGLAAAVLGSLIALVDPAGDDE